MFRYPGLTKTAIFVVGFLSLITAQACRPDSQLTSAVKGAQPPTLLGQGQNSLNGLGRAVCLNVTKKTSDEAGPKSGFQLIESIDQLSQLLNLTPADLLTGADGNPLAQFALNGSSKTKPRVVLVLATLKRIRHSEEVIAAKLDKESAEESDYQRDYPSFVKACGDSYINLIEQGDAYYGLIPIVLESHDQKDTLKTYLTTSDSASVFAKLKEYAVQDVQTYWSGTEVKDEPELALKSFDNFVAQFQSLRKSDFGFGDKVVTLKTLPYSSLNKEENFPTPDSKQKQRSLYISSFHSLGSSTLKAEQCQRRLSATLDNPVEYTKTTLDLIAKQTSLTAYYDKAKDLVLRTCVADPCLTGICEPTVCKSDVAAETQDLINQCAQYKDNELPVPLATDPYIYRSWLDSQGKVGPFGAMEALSQNIDADASQKFAKGFVVRADKATNKSTVLLRPVIYQRWRELRSKLGAPLVQPAYPFNGAEVADFANGRLVSVNPGTVAEKAYFVKNIFPSLGSDLPASDELNLDKYNVLGLSSTFEGRSELRTQGGSLLFAYESYNVMSPTVKQIATGRLYAGGGLADFYRNSGGINWAVPVTNETEVGTRGLWYFKASNGLYYWWNPGIGVRNLNNSLSALYIQNINNGVDLGFIVQDHSCDDSTCYGYFQNKILKVNRYTGTRLCDAGFRANSAGACEPVSCGWVDNANRIFNDKWNVNVSNGLLTKRCDENAAVKNYDMTCNSGYQKNIAGGTCDPASCGNLPSGQSRTEPLDEGGDTIYTCSYGVLSSTIKCYSTHYKMGQRCVEKVDRCRNSPNCPRNPPRDWQ